MISGVLTLSLGLLAYEVFQWRQKICTSKRVTIPISNNASSTDEVADDPCPPPKTSYEVFISFRGRDTRDNFTSHLCHALCQKKIKTFIDNDRLNRGEEISSTLTKTIKRSDIYVIVFSEDYASSPWCLDELVEILKWKKRYDRLVIPIFYNVEPSNVRRQTGSYADSFVKHTRRFQNDADKVHKWKAALTEASNLSGFDSAITRPEPKLIANIVEDILKKLKRNSSYDFEGLVGIQDHISIVESYLNIGSQDVRIVGIWGMGGIGKTTIAEAMFYKLQPQFESHSFVPSIQEQLRTTGLDNIRDKYVQELLEEESIGMHSFRSLFVKKLLQQKNILLVLDDVNKSSQIEDLIRQRDWFGPGSRIIITSRNRQVLRTANVDEIYHVKEMTFDDALQLFSRRAFKQNLQVKHCVEFSIKAVNYCKGVPLALKVLGSFLYGRTEQEWENALEKLQNAPHKEIFDVLKLSFDGLDDDEKEIFLDIVLFYDGMQIEMVKKLLVSCGFFPDIGISILMERSLISTMDQKLVMHNLIKVMGRGIVCQPNMHKSRTGRRLWKHEDIYHVLKKKKGTEKIHGMSLDVSKIKKIDLRSDVFGNMNNLKILQFYNPHWLSSSRLQLLDGLENLPEELRLFQWDGYPHRFVPLNHCAENIVELIMRGSHVTQLCLGNQHLPNLKTINLEDSKHLIEIPDLSLAPNIKSLNFSRCTNLSQVYSSELLSDLCLVTEDCNALKRIQFGGSNNVQQRSWRLLAVDEFFIFHRFKFRKLSMRIFKSDSSNTYSLRLNSVPVPFGGISQPESMDNDSAVLKPLHATLKNVLPNLKQLSLLDELSSLGNLKELLHLQLQYFNYGIEPSERCLMLRTCPELVERAESLCSPCMKGKGNKEVVLSWEWEDLMGGDDNSTDHNIHICHCRLSKVPSNNFRWECLIQVSLYRSDILTTQPASIHSPLSLNSVLLYDYGMTHFNEELTFTLDSENPEKVSEVSLNLAGRNLDHQLLLHFIGNGWSKAFYVGNWSFVKLSDVHISLSLFLILKRLKTNVRKTA